MSKVFIKKINEKFEERVLEALEWISWEEIVKPDARVFIKPNFTYPTYKEAVTTSPRLLEALVKILRKRTGNITIGETDGGYFAWKAEEAFRNHNLYELKEKYGIKLLNLYDSPVDYLKIDINSRRYDIPLPAELTKETDVFISAPVLKVHNNTVFSFGLKNQWGIVLDPFRLRFHHIFNESILKINDITKPAILISDASVALNETGPMEGKVERLDLVIASDDIFAFDMLGAEILGFNISQIPYLSYIQSVGRCPRREDIVLNEDIEKYKRKFILKYSLRKKLTLKMFNSKLLTYIFYYSLLGVVLHKIMYFIQGRKIKIRLDY